MLAALPRHAGGGHQHAARRRAVQPGAGVRPPAPAGAGDPGRHRRRTSYLTHLAREGLNTKYPFAADDVSATGCSTSSTSSRRRGFTNYFLVVHDIAQFCQRSNIMLGVRGSAAASIILYALDVTFIDPLAAPPRLRALPARRPQGAARRRPRHPRRPPRRGDPATSPRSTATTASRRSSPSARWARRRPSATPAARSACRTATSTASRALVPNALHMTLEKRARGVARTWRSLYETDSRVSELVDTARRLEGRRAPRQHARRRRRDLARAAGRARAAAAPARAATSRSIPTTQYAMAAGRRDRPAEDGLPRPREPHDPRRRAIDIIERTQRRAHRPADAARTATARTFEMLAQGDTFGVFQLESPGMRRAIVRSCGPTAPPS